MTISLAAGLLAIGSSALLAQESTNVTPNAGQVAPQTPNAKKKAEQRNRILAILGLTRQDLKGLTPADRRAKIKSLADAKIAQLQQKKTAGSLTDKEQSDLDALKKFEQRGHAKAAPAN